MKKFIGWLFIISAIGNTIRALGASKPDAMFYALIALGIGLWILGVFKNNTSKEANTNSSNSIDNNNVTTDVDISDHNNYDLGEEMRIKLKSHLLIIYNEKYQSRLSENQIEMLADKISIISKSYSDTSISILNLKNLLGKNLDKSEVKKTILSCSNNYSKNTMHNLGIVGNILGNEIIDIPHLSSENSLLTLENIHQQGFELITLGQQVGIESEVIQILSKA